MIGLIICVAVGMTIGLVLKDKLVSLKDKVLGGKPPAPPSAPAV